MEHLIVCISENVRVEEDSEGNLFIVVDGPVTLDVDEVDSIILALWMAEKSRSTRRNNYLARFDEFPS